VQTPIFVRCPYLDGLGRDPISPTRPLGGQQFCVACGETDHEPISVRR
jgi:hypothetical protein